ncbi:hypothetical protein DMB42_52030 [Nonomuraea sp. WAC 01424]|nr:hypothetical protein DMB42_52030 [Nonomuraea sp. WAC 01424]
MITGTARQVGGDRWGHHWPERWTVVEEGQAAHGRAGELFIAGELLALGAPRVLQTLLHEAAHSLAYARGIKDTSRSGNRYHNGKFAELAEEMGLCRPAKPSKAHGFSACEITEATIAEYEITLKELTAAQVAYLTDLHETGGTTGGGDDEEEGEGGKKGGKGKGRAGKRFAVECQCTPARRLQVSPKTLEDGPVICGRCGEQFAAVEPTEEQED